MADSDPGCVGALDIAGGDLSNLYVGPCCCHGLVGLLGFMDDYLKVTNARRRYQRTA